MRLLGVLRDQQGNTAEAEHWWRKAAEAGDTDAMHNLGVMLYNQGKITHAEHWRER